MVIRPPRAALKSGLWLMMAGGGGGGGGNKWSNRTAGLLKLEFEGTRGITLCSKCYCMENEEKSKARL